MPLSAQQLPPNASVYDLSPDGSDTAFRDDSPPPYTKYPTEWPSRVVSLLSGEPAFSGYSTHRRVVARELLDVFKTAAFSFTTWHVVIDAIGQCPGVKTSLTAYVIFHDELYRLDIGKWVTTINHWAIFRCLAHHPDPHNIFTNQTGFLRVPLQYVSRDQLQVEPPRFFISSNLETKWKRIYESLHCKAVLTFSPVYSIAPLACGYRYHRLSLMFESDIRDYAEEMERVYREQESAELGLREEITRTEARPSFLVRIVRATSCTRDTGA